MGVKHH